MQNKRRKLEFERENTPVVILGSSSDEEESDDDYVGNCSEERSTEKNRKKKTKGKITAEIRRRESNNCHQCQRNDKGRVLCCSNCKARRYCLPCVTRWYPGMCEEDFLEACPVCRCNCNCTACLRSTKLVQQLMNEGVKFSDEEKLEYSKRIVRALLPALEHLNAEQMIEKEIECQIQGLSDSKVKMQKVKYEKDERIYCNCCKASIVDFHRSCSMCSYEVCLTCCKELRNGNLLADMSEVTMQYINHGPGYLHDEGCSKTSANCSGVGEVKRDQTRTSKWKANKNGTIPCPPEDMGGCNKGTLSLKCLFSENWISQLLLRANEIAQKCKLKESELHYSSEDDACLRKAASRQNSDDNYVWCPDIRHAKLKRFQLHLSRGEPTIITNVLENALRLSWEPMVMWRAWRQSNKDTDVLNCLNWCKLKMNIHQFFKGYVEGRFDSKGWPQLLKMDDWPPSGQFDEWLPRHAAEFSRCLPFKEYTHPQYARLNLALRIPHNCLKPDLGPKAYISYGFPKKLGRGDSVTKLHYVVSDTVNMLMHTQAVVPTEEQLSVIEKLKQIHKAQDQRECVANAYRVNKGCVPNVNGKSVPNSSSKVEDKMYSQQGIKAECVTNKDVEKYQDREHTSSNSYEGFEEADGGALWDVFRRQDIPKLEEYLRKHFREFRHIYGSPLPQVVHPIHDETFYLSTEHKRRIKEEYGVEPWTFVQKLGEAVFIPAGCPHQVRHLKSCIIVAADFVSPENVNECIRLTKDFRKLPKNHDAKEDKLDVKKIIVHAMSEAVEHLEKTTLYSEAGTAAGLSSSNLISKSKKATQKPSTPKSPSVTGDLSSSKTVEREDYVAPSEDEKPIIGEVHLHSQLPDFVPSSSANKAQGSTSQNLKLPFNLEDVESTFQTVESFLNSLPEQSQLGAQSNSASNQTLAKTLFECSIRHPLEALADPIREKEMWGAIAAIKANPSLLSDEQAKQLVKLELEFPIMVKKWRDLSQAESSCREILTSFDENRKKLDNLIRSEVRLKLEYEKRAEQARELEATLQDIKMRQKQIMEERQEASQEARRIMLLAKEKAGKVGSARTELVTTQMQMDGLTKSWSSYRHSF